MNRTEADKTAVVCPEPKRALLPSGPINRLPEEEAWLTCFFIENHLDHYAHPDQVATPEQTRFMIHLENGQRYHPCSDRMFQAIMSRQASPFLQGRYREVLKRMRTLIDDHIADSREREYLKYLIEIKFRHETRDEIMIPSRLEKRLLQIFLNRSQIEDPFICEKARRNLRASRALASPAFEDALNHVPDIPRADIPNTLAEIRLQVRALEIRRLLKLSVVEALWMSDAFVQFSKSDYLKLFERPMVGDGVQVLMRFLGLEDTHHDTAQSTIKKKILWLADEAGEVMLDLAIVQFLARLGHKIVIAFKEGPLFTKVDFLDAQEDENLNTRLHNAFWIRSKSLSKNELVRILRSDHNIFVTSDGTREQLNLLLASTTFARIFKEVDAIVTKGPDLKRRFFETPFQFTQDIFNISAHGEDSVAICYKPRHPLVIKFSHHDLEKRAAAIIERMREVKRQGMTVVFYSGIIGSIPGKLHMAKQIMSVFIEFLREQSDMTFIINPSEYYEAGMDADDLMYMWEIVQRSGLIDIWRFQTYSDIGKAFRILNQMVPPEWVGKDATYSTGCTKEMKIALEVQAKYPEMQIIGPSREKFMRRNEYGVGKMYDRRLGEICKLN